METVHNDPKKLKLAILAMDNLASAIKYLLTPAIARLVKSMDDFRLLAEELSNDESNPPQLSN